MSAICKHLSLFNKSHTFKSTVSLLGASLNLFYRIHLCLCANRDHIYINMGESLSIIVTLLTWAIEFLNEDTKTLCLNIERSKHDCLSNVLNTLLVTRIRPKNALALIRVVTRMDTLKSGWTHCVYYTTHQMMWVQVYHRLLSVFLEPYVGPRCHKRISQDQNRLVQPFYSLGFFSSLNLVVDCFYLSCDWLCGGGVTPTPTWTPPHLMCCVINTMCPTWL